MKQNNILGLAAIPALLTLVLAVSAFNTKIKHLLIFLIASVFLCAVSIIGIIILLIKGS